MKGKKKQKAQASHRGTHRSTSRTKRQGMGNRPGGEQGNNVDTGLSVENEQPEQDITPGINRARGERQGSGAFDQEGEGNRQNDQSAELDEDVEREEK